MPKCAEEDMCLTHDMLVLLAPDFVGHCASARLRSTDLLTSGTWILWARNTGYPPIARCRSRVANSGTDYRSCSERKQKVQERTNETLKIGYRVIS